MRHIPKITPYQLAVRIQEDVNGTNMPQVQFGDNGVWHDFAHPVIDRWTRSTYGDMDALSSGPFFPYLKLTGSSRLANHSVSQMSAPPSSKGPHVSHTKIACAPSLDICPLSLAASSEKKMQAALETDLARVAETIY